MVLPEDGENERRNASECRSQNLTRCTEDSALRFYVLLTVHPNITVVFFFYQLHAQTILVYLLHSSTWFEHYCAHLQEDNCINTASGIVTLETSGLNILVI